MARTFAETKAGYSNMWNNASLIDAKKPMAMAAAKKICSEPYKSVFLAVQSVTKVPWWFTGGIAYREDDIDLNAYIGNGQSLLKKTTVVPIDRGPFIKNGRPDFLAGCVDAFGLQGFLKYKPEDWTIPFALFQAEEFNGEGYENKNVDSPYVWAGTSWEQSGLFTEDHGFDPNKRDPRVGVAAIWACIAELDPSILQPPTSANTGATNMANGGAGQASTVGQAPTVTIPTPQPVSAHDLAKITDTIEKIVVKLPQYAFILNFIPSAAPIVALVIPFVPVVDHVLLTLEKIENANGDWGSIISIIESDFASISAEITAARAKAGV